MTPDEFDALPFPEQVRVLTSAIATVIDGYQHRLAVRQLDGRVLSAVDQRNLRALVLSMECVLLESKEHLEPGSMKRSIDAAFAALADAQGDGQA